MVDLLKNVIKKLLFNTKKQDPEKLSLPGLMPDDVAAIEKYIQQRLFNFEELIYERGTPSAALYYINSGSVGLFTLVNEIQKERTQYISGGRWFGISALLENEVRSHTAIALEDTDVLVITTSDLKALFAAEPFVGNRFLLALVADLHATQVEMGEEYSKLLSKLTQSNIIV